MRRSSLATTCIWHAAVSLSLDRTLFLAYVAVIVTIMEVRLLDLFSLFPAELGSKGKGVDLLFGLDMLKRHQAILDLQRNELVIQGRHVRFLSEHELPDAARDDNAEVDECVAFTRSYPSKLISLETEMATSKYLALAVLLTRIKLSVQRQRPMLKPKRPSFRKVGVRRRAILPPPRLQCSRQAAALGILKQRYRV